ncbi:hypothetical protein [Agromyces sp. H66]|uniref:hypothetical protein n=1 Tax=Agromyces sp. H66 TaxID=2529859 RepID=UPI0010AB2BDA|nr:hypothetical protein [Agromyces sp. H66]
MFRTRRRAASGFAVFVIFATLALAGCARGETPGVASLGDGSTTSPTASEAPAEGDAVKFAACMREHGIDVPDPDPDADGFSMSIPRGTSEEEADAAVEACKEFAPNGGEPVQLSAEDLEGMREFAKCMRENGIEDFPDPSADGGFQIPSSPGDPDAIDPMSQEFRDAEESCARVRPAPPGGGEPEGPSTQTGGSES